MNFTKQILKPGKYLIQTPSGKRQVEEITADRLQSWADKFGKMIDAGLKIPAPYRHDLSVPLAKSQRSSKDNAGFWKELHIEKDGTLVGELEVPCKEDIERIGTTIQEVSPFVKNWKDGSGNSWEDSILHIALVTNPIIPDQENFVSKEPALALAFSQLLETDLELAAEMSMNQITEAANRTLRGEDDVPKVHDAGWIEDVYDDHLIFRKGEKYFRQDYALSDGTVNLTGQPTEVKRTVEYKKTELAMADEIEPSKKPDSDPVELNNPSADSPKTVIEALKAVGLSLPEDTTSENLGERIIVASKAIVDKKALDEGGQRGEGGTENQVEQPTPIAMSGEEIMSKELSFIHKVVGAEYVRRIDELVSSGRITPVYATEILKPMFEGFQLSLGESGEPEEGPLDVILKGLEILPVNPANLASLSSRKKKGLKLAHEEEIPAEIEGEPELTEKRTGEVVKEQMKSSGRPVGEVV